MVEVGPFDITTLDVDEVVNAANAALPGGTMANLLRSAGQTG
jgi:O-acetyl-ADP-ribose deacetylase (regulator of RNase III)